MGRLEQSRRVFHAKFTSKKNVVSSDVAQLLGGEVSEGNGNFALLDRLMTSLDCGAYNPRTFYCGVTPKVGTLAQSVSEPKADWIGIHPRYLELMAAVADVGTQFPAIVELAWGYYSEDAETLGALSNYRDGMFRHAGNGRPGESEREDYPDLSGVWEGHRDSDRWQDELGAAVLFVLAHEVAHHANSEKQTRDTRGMHVATPERAARVAKSRAILGSTSLEDRTGLWPKNVKHQNELMADHDAVNYVAASAAAADLDLTSVMRGSFVSCLADAFDGWFNDKSAKSHTHPSPFARNLSLFLAWAEFLASQAKLGWKDAPQPTNTDLLGVVNSFLMVEWAAGEYGPHRSGMLLWAHRRDLHSTLSGAAGLGRPEYLEVSVP